MSRKNPNTYYICYAWDEDEKRMVDFFGSRIRKECEEECQCLTLGTRHKIVRVDEEEGQQKSHHWASNSRNSVELGRVIAESKGKKPKPSNGAEVLAWQQFKTHEGDKHLFYVLCRFNNQFVVWTFNAQDGGCYYGKYSDACDLDKALEKFEQLAEPHRNFKQLTAQEKFELDCVSIDSIPENYSHPSHLSRPLGEYEKEEQS
jgi:hypothetical protein